MNHVLDESILLLCLIGEGEQEGREQSGDLETSSSSHQMTGIRLQERQ